LNGRVNLADAAWITIVSTLILAIGSLPTWVGRAVQNDDMRFRGIYFDEQDYAVHIAMIQAGRLGDWSYQMRFTSEPQRPVVIKMFYIILGHLSAWTHLPPETMYHVARWLLGYAALFAIYGLCLRVLTVPSLARSAFLLAALGSGLGWLQLMLGAPMAPISPIDFWLIDAYVFFSLSVFPHFAYQLALMAASLSLYLAFLERPAWKKILWIGLMALAAQLANPISFAPLGVSFVCATFVQWWKLRKIEGQQVTALAVLIAVQLPMLIYNFIILSRDPVWIQFTTQNRTLSPPPSFYFWGLALFWPFAVQAALNAIRTRSAAGCALVAWALSGLMLAYTPLPVQRRFLLGVTIPMGILAILGLMHVLETLRVRLPAMRRRTNAIVLGYALLGSVSSLYLSFGSSLFMQTRPPEYFYPAALESGLHWLDERSSSNDFALGSPETGQLIAQRTDLRAYIGHEMETLHFAEKQALVAAFYRGDLPGDWLAQTPIRWVIYSPLEANLSTSFEGDEHLQLVYENATTSIYEVRFP